jgi:hypothetical protein
LLANAASAQELKKIKIGYPAFSLTFLTFFVTKDAGIYKRHGLDVDLVNLLAQFNLKTAVEYH